MIKISLIRKDAYLLKNSLDTIFSQMLIATLILLFLKFPNFTILLEFFPYIIISGQLIFTVMDILYVKDKKAGINKILNIAYKKREIVASRFCFIIIFMLAFDILFWFVQKYAYFIFRIATRPLTITEYMAICCFACVIYLIMNMFYCLLAYEKAKYFALATFLLPIILIFSIAIWKSAGRKAEVVRLMVNAQTAVWALVAAVGFSIVIIAVSIAGYRK